MAEYFGSNPPKARRDSSAIVHFSFATRDLDTLAWIGFGASAAFGLTTLGTGVAALGASSDLKALRFGDTEPTPDVIAKRKEVRTLAAVSDVFLGATVLTLASTMVYTFVHTPRMRTVGQAPLLRKNAELRVGMPGSLLGAGIAGEF